MFLHRFNRLLYNNFRTLKATSVRSGPSCHCNGFDMQNYGISRYQSTDMINDLRNVYVNARFLKIGEIDTLKEKFTADTLLTVRWKMPEIDMDLVKIGKPLKPSQFWNPEIYIHNLEVPKIEIDDVEPALMDNEVWFTQRMRFKGSFYEHLELEEFPFDLQDLSLYITSKKQVNLLDDPVKMHTVNLENFTDESEWHLYNYVCAENTALKVDLTDPNLEMPCLLVQCKVFRKSKFYIYNIFLITLLVAGLGFCTFAVNMKKVENRLQLVFILILALITLRWGVAASLPKIAYLTFLDKYTLIAMASLGLCCLSHATAPFFAEDSIMKTNESSALLGVISLYAILNILFGLQVMKNPLKKWRLMKMAEKVYMTSLRKS